MKVHQGIKKYNFKKAVVTIGTFDGVHLGHQKILIRILELADKIQGDSVLVTFWPHPRIVLYNKDDLQLLNTLDEKIEILENIGIKHLVIIPFTKEFAALSAEEFIEDIIIDKIAARYVIFGYDHHFGKNRSGDYNNLARLAKSKHFQIEQVKAYTINNINISSTKIRRALLAGDISTANSYLGYKYFINGIVIPGYSVGHKIGFPTANIKINDEFKALPKIGVYDVDVVIADTNYRAMLNIGYCPTVQNSRTQLKIETHVFNFNKNIYNKKIKIFFNRRIRDEKKFASLDELKKQLENDKKMVLSNSLL